MGWSRTVERLRDTAPAAVRAVQSHAEPPLYPKQLSERQVANRVGPVLPLIAKRGLGTDEPAVVRGVGRAIEKLYVEQEAARNGETT